MSSMLGFICALIPTLLFSQSLVLNEILASNQSGLRDEDGDTPDWIEIYNPTPSAIDLNGFALSDDIEDPNKWRFETGQIAAGGHTIIFASDKDRQGENIFWDLIISEGEDWSYFVGSSNPPTNWKSSDFDASSWSMGPSGFGYGDDDDNTVIPATLSVFLRKSVTIENFAEIEGLLFHIDYDDGYIAFINGIEFSRANLGLPGTPANNTTTADNYTEPALAQGFDLPFHLIPQDILTEGENILAIQVHNHSTTSSDLTAIPFLSIGRSDPPTTALPDYLLVPESSLLHTNFKVSSSGELLTLTSPNGILVDSLRTPELPSNISWGRQPDAGTDLLYFTPPTPGAMNTGGSTTLPELPELTPAPGFYSGGIVLNMGTVPPGRIYKYTRDGATPDLSSPEYTSPFPITETTVVRVMTSNPDGSNTTQSSYSYFINEDPYLPVMSLIFEPGAFFDNDSGLYVMGDNASQSFPHFGANFWEDWERQVHIEYFEDGDDLSYAGNAGAKIFGGWSRGNPQRSISLFARGRYGTGKFQYPFFSDLNIDSFEAMVLRNSGNDWNMSGYRDGFMTGLVDEVDLEKQAFQPVEVYFNGEYWGIYNLREKVNEHFLASHHDIDSDDVDLLGFDGSEVINGENTHYLDLLNYVNNNALNSEADFEYVQDRVDIRNFIDYQLSQIYYDNQDWPGNNIKFWRPRQPGGKWRWILYDTDFGFSTWSQNNYMRNTLEFATDPAGPGWPNPPWSTLLLRKFLTNPQFKQDFILTACDLLNQPFRPDVVDAALNGVQQGLMLSLPTHFQRWGHNDFVHWTSEGLIMDDFAQNRPAYMRNHFRNKFNLGADSQFEISIYPPHAGKVKVHSIMPDSYPWTGTYFSDVPLDIRAIALSGFQFSHWEGIGGDDPDLSISLLNSVSLTAVFEPVSPDDGALVINEINYHSDSGNDCADWIELYNGTQMEIDLSSWFISDGADDNQFVLPELILPSDGYLIASVDSLAFRAVHGNNIPLIGDIDFNFSNGGELIRLFNSDNILVDSVRYDDGSPWPTEPDGDGPTLELTHPSLDNGLSESWAASDNLGTPGARNSRYANPASMSQHHVPQSFHVGMAFPNPFNARVSIPFTAAPNRPIRIDIFDVRGRTVKSETLDPMLNALALYQWDGTTSSGTDCGSGMYIVRVSQDNVSASTKIALLR
ncbi:MAG: T9SS type A sorting domain-containing protein [Candidatus Marinimicrobia bacterium]|nr:T9SS type A sorting domain-containing protein [Candidatus Neomarinimicrobiota bacterium]